MQEGDLWKGKSLQGLAEMSVAAYETSASSWQEGVMPADLPS